MLQGKDSPRRHSFSSTIKSELLLHKNVNESTGNFFFCMILGVIGDKLSVCECGSDGNVQHLADV